MSLKRGDQRLTTETVEMVEMVEMVETTHTGEVREIVTLGHHDGEPKA
jgi:hypothetical protein